MMPSSSGTSNAARNDIDIGLAKKQHRDYVSILGESGVKVIELPPLEEFPDSVFMQDPALLGSHITVIGRFGEEMRRGEEEALLTITYPALAKSSSVFPATSAGNAENTISTSFTALGLMSTTSRSRTLSGRLLLAVSILQIVSISVQRFFLMLQQLKPRTMDAYSTGG
jgi:dimethylargininase